MADILLLDDSEDLVEMFQILFNRKGFGLRSTSTESSFFTELNRQKPDLVILDIMLSDSDGRDVYINLKSKDNIKDVPVIMMSSNPKLLESCKGIYGEDYLEKPFEITDLLNKVNHYINRQGN